MRPLAGAHQDTVDASRHHAVLVHVRDGPPLGLVDAPEQTRRVQEEQPSDMTATSSEPMRILVTSPLPAASLGGRYGPLPIHRSR